MCDRDKQAFKNNDGTLRLQNVHLKSLDRDVLYHLGLDTENYDLPAMFGDVKFVCMGGTKYRMRDFAAYIRQVLGLPDEKLINLTKHSHRYAMYKVGPVLSVSHGIGIPSMTILLQELIKLMYYAKAQNPVFFRIGTSGGLGIPAGSLVVSEWGMNGLLQKCYQLPVLGELRRLPSMFEASLCEELLTLSLEDDGFQTLKGGTFAADDFYRGQARMDGPFCDHTEAEKLTFLTKLTSLGVRNIEMEATAFAAFTLEAGVRAADVCVTLVNRLEGDQRTTKYLKIPPKCELDSHTEGSERSEALSGRLSKSASELSCAPSQGAPPRARSAHHHTPLSVVHRTQHFFTNLKSRWNRSKSRERCPAGTALSLAPGESSTDNASSDSTPANSPRHRGRLRRDQCLIRQLSTEPGPSTSGTPAHHSKRPQDLLQLEPDEGQRLREQHLRQYAFFQLRIHLKRGQNLVAMDKNGLLSGTSDPYVKFKVGGRLLHKSRIVYRDLNPVWDECFTVPIEDPFQPVQLKVFDYDWGLQDDFMGSCQLDLTALELGRTQDLVLCLKDPNKPNLDMGEIVLNVTLWPKSQEDKDQYLMKNTKLCDVNKRLKAQIWSSVVTIVLVEAKNLPAMDLDTRSSDPYCKFRLGNEKYKSKVVWKTLHPSWLEQFDLHLYDDQEQILEVTVWDKDQKTKDDFLGRCTIDLSALEREKTHNIRKELEDGNGQIFLLLTISGTTQSETITDLTSYKENPRDIEIIEKRYQWHRLNEQSSGVGWLCVKVYGAKGLAAADLGGKSDPFCVLELGNSRLQTHTEYKTLCPNWMKIFTFTVKDISSILELTVYDEDHDHKVEFLGKLAISLLSIRNHEKRWYALKDKKMRARAKGNYPQILLEMVVIWNPLKAAIRVVNPKEPKYMHQEAKFKRQLFIRNVMRLKAIIMWFLEVGKILQDCFEWESRILSFCGLLIWLTFCYFYEMWMLPLIVLCFFIRNWLIYRLTGGNQLLVPVDDDDLLAEDDDEEEGEKEEKKSLKERLQAIQEVTQTVQNAIGYVASLGEAVKNLMNFTVPYLSYIAIIMVFCSMTVLYVIPLRYLLMAWGINKFTRKILRPHTIPNNEVLDLLSRVPDDETLLDCRELKPHPTSEHRRDARKKHKVT